MSREPRLVVRLNDTLVDRSFIERLDTAAKTLGVTKSRLVRAVIADALAHPERLREMVR